MSGERLREELARIAEGAPQVELPADLYARGRRATGRARLLAAGAAVACIALLVAVVTPALQDDHTPIAGDAGLGVPNHIHAVPRYVTDREKSFQIGIGAAAFVTEERTAVVVDGATGDYHLFDLDGLLGADPDSSVELTVSMDNPPVALSPDGRYLAWGWVEPGPSSGTQLKGSGIRIADLDTGAVREIDVVDSDSSQAYRVLVNQVSWAPGGQWLAWGGTRVTEWTSSTFNSNGYLAGTVNTDAGDTTMTRLPEPTIETDQETPAGDVPFVVAVSNEGELSAISGNLWWRVAGQERISLRGDQRISTLWSAGDRWFALVHSDTGDEVPMVRELPGGPDRAATTLASKPRILGVLSDGRLLSHEGVVDEQAGPPPIVEAITPDGAAERVIDVDPGVLGLTIAADLITPEQLTVGRPAPDWPWATERKLVVGGLVLLGLVLLGGVVLGARRLSTR
ncbi:hypothetical protein [Nocardioides sp. GCM10030258]|uniref:hypothetical protein n=1 Tax=unclassified Nocardioides TaxID=2615069 RepID=UPI0036125AB7